MKLFVINLPYLSMMSCVNDVIYSISNKLVSFLFRNSTILDLDISVQANFTVICSAVNGSMHCQFRPI